METILTKRNVEWLFHFTRVENLQSIFNNGLVPREGIDGIKVKGIVNDEYRFDNCENANCLSVEFPNYKMFFTLCCKEPNTNWVILALDSKLLSNYKCAFCYANAGSKEIYSVPLINRQGLQAFEDIFSERDIYPKREILNIPECYPTNPQAEVLVFGTIPTSYIKYVIFKDNNIFNLYKSIIPLHIV